MEKRKVSKEDRLIWRRNALIGTKKWKDMSPEEREKEKHREKYSEWGFEGRSPKTKERKHIHVKEHVRHIRGKEVHVKEHYREVLR